MISSFVCFIMKGIQWIAIRSTFNWFRDCNACITKWCIILAKWWAGPHEVNLVLLVRAMFLIFLVKETWWLVEMGELIWTAEFLLSDFWNSPVNIGDYFKLLYFSSTVCRTYIFIHVYIYWQYVSESIKRKLNEKRTHWVNPFTPSHQYA